MAECFVDENSVGIIMSHEAAALVCCLVGGVSGAGAARKYTSEVYSVLQPTLCKVGIVVNSDLVREVFGKDYAIALATETMPKLRKEE